MKKSKRVLCMLVAVSFAVSMSLAGCGLKAKNDAAADSSKSAQTTTQTTEAKLDPVELNWYLVFSPQPEQDEVFAQANKMIQEKINATVKFNVVDWGSYNDKMQVLISSGEPIDLCFTANWINNYNQNVAKGAFKPLDELLDNYAPKLKASIPEKIWNATKVDGKIYGIINYQISALTNGFYLSKEKVEQYGFDTKNVKKLEDLEPFLKSVKEKDPGLIPLDFSAGSMAEPLGKLTAYLGFDEIGGRHIPGAVRIANNNIKAENQFASEEYKAYFKLMREWYKKGYIREDALNVKDVDADLKAKKIVAGLEGTIKPGGEAEWKAAKGWDIVDVPVSQSVLLTSSIISTMHAIPNTSANPERAMMLMELLNSDKDIYNTIVFGIEDKHYKKVGDNKIELIADSKYNAGVPWEIASTFNAYLLPGQPDTVWEDTKKINENAVASPIIGFAFDATPVASEIAQCNSVKDEMLPALELGAVDPDEILPKFLDKLEKAGASKIIAEMQKQIDTWKSGKK